MKISSLASFCSALDDEELFILLSAILDRRPELVDLLEGHFEKSSGRAAERRRSANGKTISIANGAPEAEAMAVVAMKEKQEENPEDAPDEWWIHSNKANMIFGFVIIINSVTIGVFTDYPPSRGLGLIIDLFFNSVFILELGLRIVAEKQNVIFSGWNWLDAILVGFGAIDFAFSVYQWVNDVTAEGGLLRMFSILRIVRVLKLVRLLRLFRMFSDLWILCIGLVSALKALVWLFLLLFIFMYVCAIVLTRQVGQPLLEPYKNDASLNCDGSLLLSDPADFELMSDNNMLCLDRGQVRHCQCLVHEYFYSVPKSMFILFQVMTGEDWPTIAEASMKALGPTWGPAIGLFFVIFILFTTFALMNLVTGIIVDKVMSSAKQCQIEMEEKEHMDGKKDLAVLKKVFKLMAHKGNLNVDHFTLGLENPNIIDALKDLDIFLGTDPDTIFNILDMNGSGTLDEQEFCRGALRMKGSTQSRHLLFVQNDLHKHSKNILRMTQEISSKLLQEGKRANHVQETLDQIWHFMRRQASNRWITDPFHSSLHQMISEIYLITRDMNAEAQRKEKEKAERSK